MLTATRGPYVLVIQPDDDPFNPREDETRSIPVRMTILGKWSAFTGSITWATITIT